MFLNFVINFEFSLLLIQVLHFSCVTSIRVFKHLNNFGISLAFWITFLIDKYFSKNVYFNNDIQAILKWRDSYIHNMKYIGFKRSLVSFNLYRKKRRNNSLIVKICLICKIGIWIYRKKKIYVSLIIANNRCLLKDENKLITWQLLLIWKQTQGLTMTISFTKVRFFTITSGCYLSNNQ